MATESRIGIAFGFVIVAIASVYFIYGSDRSDDDLLLTDETKIAKTDVKKPSSAAKANDRTKKKTSKTSNAAQSRRSASSHSPSKRSSTAKPANDTNLANRSQPINKSKATKTNPRVSNPILARNKSTVPTRRDPIRIPSPAEATEKVADAKTDSPAPTNPIAQTTRNQPTRTFRGPTPLNSGASKKLVDATEKNLNNPTDETSGNNNTATPTRTINRKTLGDASTDDKLVDPVRAARARARNVSPTRDHRTPWRTSGDLENQSTTARKTKRPDGVWPRSHTVVSGDTLSEISMRYYDTSRNVAEILAANPSLKSASALKVGQVLTLPALTADELAAKPEMTNEVPLEVTNRKTANVAKRTTKTYTVRKGDTFYSIAKSVYGTTSRWKDIFKANKRVVKNKPTNLKPGMILRVPA